MEPDTQLESEVVELYEAHAAGMTRYAASLTHCEDLARDAVQETFLRYFAERSYGRLIDYPRAWLYQVLRHYLFDGMASSSPLQELSDQNLDSMSDPGGDPEEQVQRAEMAAHVIECLSVREREALGLRSDGFSYIEIAGIMGLKTGTVGALLARAHQKIREATGRSKAEESEVARAVHFLFQGGSPCRST